MEYDPNQQIKVLIEMVVVKLNLEKPEDYLKAETAVRTLIYKDYQGSDIKVTNQKQFHYLLPKLQKAFVLRQFEKRREPVREAVAVLERMDKGTQYPDMIGYKHVKDLLMDSDGTALERCVNIS